MIKAKKGHLKELNELINSAYRGESSKKGWTTEADLLNGIRTSEESLLETINREDTDILILQQENEIVACVQLLNKNTSIYVGMLTVKPTMQNSGLGKKILHTCDLYAKEKGIYKLEMTVISQRLELIAWYERHGFIKTGEKRPFPMGDPRFGEPKEFLEFVVLEKSLYNNIEI